MSCCIKYRQVSNISHPLVCNQIVDHSDVVGASPVGAYIRDLGQSDKDRQKGRWIYHRKQLTNNHPTRIQHEYVITSIIKWEMKLFDHSQTSQ